MMRIFVSCFLFLLGMLVGACGTAAQMPIAAPTSPAERVSATDLAEKTIALIGQDSAGAMRPYCSGVWVGASLIATAHHCMSEDAHVDEHVAYVVRDDVLDGSEVRALITPRIARVVTLAPDQDLALLQALAAPSHAIAHVAAAAPVQGMHAYSMGHSLGLWWSYGAGDIAAIRKMDAGVNIVWVQTTAPTSPGNSGGGLFDEDGNLIGICSRTLSNPRAQGLNLYVHPAYLAALLASVQAY